MFIFCSILIGYVFGSIPIGYLIAKSKGVDIFTVGSKSVGTTNIKRVLGKKTGNIVFVLDLLKTIIPIIIILNISWDFKLSINNYVPYNTATTTNVLRFSTGLGAVLGHIFPFTTKFKGGKGIASTLAVVFCFSIPFALLLFLIYKIVVKFTKYVSVGSIAAETCLILLSTICVIFYIYPYNFYNSYILLPFVYLISIICIIKHKDNIKRLLNGEENKIVKK